MRLVRLGCRPIEGFVAIVYLTVPNQPCEIRIFIGLILCGVLRVVQQLVGGREGAESCRSPIFWACSGAGWTRGIWTVIVSVVRFRGTVLSHHILVRLHPGITHLHPAYKASTLTTAKMPKVGNL